MIKGNGQLTDEQLVSLCPPDRIDTEFTILYQRYVQKVYRKCLMMTSDAEDARDFTQDIFLKVFDKLSTFENRSTFSTWLYCVSHNYCLDKLKENKRLKREVLSSSILELTIDESTESAETTELTNSLLDQMPELLQKLSEEEAILLQLKYEEGLSVKEISQRFRVKESTIKMRLKRSRDRLRKMYEGSQNYVV